MTSTKQANKGLSGILLIGGIVLMNLLSGYDAEAYVTTRANKINLKHGVREFTDLDYGERYEYLDQMDVLISATSSPHYTLTFNKMIKYLETEKPRVFVDLAVPMDIDPQIGSLENCTYYNIDDFAKISEENNEMDGLPEITGSDAERQGEFYEGHGTQGCEQGFRPLFLLGEGEQQPGGYRRIF